MPILIETPTEDYFPASSLAIDESSTSSRTSTNLIAEIESQDPLWNETLLDTLWVEEEHMPTTKIKPEIRIKQEHRDRRRPNSSSTSTLKKQKSKSTNPGLRRGNKRKASSPEFGSGSALSTTSMKKKSLKSLNKSPPEGYTRTEEADVKLRELEAQLKNLDPNSKEAKKQRRLIRNRMSAQLHRERKKAYVDHLEAELAMRDETIDALVRQVERLSRDNLALETRLNEPPPETKSPEDVFTDMLTSEDMLEISETMVFGPLEDEGMARSMPSSPASDHSDVESIGSLDSRSFGSKNVKQQHPSSSSKPSTNNNMAMVLAVVLSLTFFGPPTHMLELLETLASGGQELEFADVLGLPQPPSALSPRVRVLDSISGTKWEDPTTRPELTSILLKARDRTTAVQVLLRDKEEDEDYPSFSVLVPTKPGSNHSSSCQWLEIEKVSSKF